jgi:hypothetical protein
VNLHPRLDARHGLAFTLGLLLAIAYVASLTGCTEPTQPVTSCRPLVIQTPQGPWTTGQRICEATDPLTGQGHAVSP